MSRTSLSHWLLAAVATGLVAPSVAASAETPFELALADTFALTSCPSGAPKGAVCVRTRVHGPSALGEITITALTIRDQAAMGPDGCFPATKTGTLTTAANDALRLTATGRNCGGPADYTFTLDNGTGALNGVTVSGAHHVGPPRDISTADGTITGAADDTYHGTIRRAEMPPLTVRLQIKAPHAHLRLKSLAIRVNGSRLPAANARAQAHGRNTRITITLPPATQRPATIRVSVRTKAGRHLVIVKRI